MSVSVVLQSGKSWRIAGFGGFSSSDGLFRHSAKQIALQHELGEELESIDYTLGPKSRQFIEEFRILFQDLRHALDGDNAEHDAKYLFRKNIHPFLLGVRRGDFGFFLNDRILKELRSLVRFKDFDGLRSFLGELTKEEPSLVPSIERGSVAIKPEEVTPKSQPLKTTDIPATHVHEEDSSEDKTERSANHIANLARLVEVLEKRVSQLKSDLDHASEGQSSIIDRNRESLARAKTLSKTIEELKNNTNIDDLQDQISQLHSGLNDATMEQSSIIDRNREGLARAKTLSKTIEELTDNTNIEDLQDQISQLRSGLSDATIEQSSIIDRNRESLARANKLSEIVEELKNKTNWEVQKKSLEAGTAHWESRVGKSSVFAGTYTVVLLVILSGAVGFFFNSFDASSETLSGATTIYQALPAISKNLFVLGILIWLARIFAKLALGEYHIRTRGLEKIAMIQTYLALVDQGEATREELRLVLANIFAPAQDGVVKDDPPLQTNPVLQTFMPGGSD